MVDFQAFVLKLRLGLLFRKPRSIEKVDGKALRGLSSIRLASTSDPGGFCRPPRFIAILCVLRDTVNSVEEVTELCTSPRQLPDAIDPCPVLHACFIRRHALRTQSIDYPGVFLQCLAVPYRVLAIFEELCAIEA